MAELSRRGLFKGLFALAVAPAVAKLLPPQQTMTWYDQNLNPLILRRMIGYKYMGKVMIQDSDRILRLELTSQYG